MRTLDQRLHDDGRIRAKRAAQSSVIGIPTTAKRFHTATLCSCPMCGNPRKWFGQRTIQERRFMQDAQ